MNKIVLQKDHPMSEKLESQLIEFRNRASDFLYSKIQEFVEDDKYDEDTLADITQYLNDRLGQTVYLNLMRERHFPIKPLDLFKEASDLNIAYDGNWHESDCVLKDVPHFERKLLVLHRLKKDPLSIFDPCCIPVISEALQTGDYWFFERLTEVIQSWLPAEKKKSDSRNLREVSWFVRSLHFYKILDFDKNQKKAWTFSYQWTRSLLEKDKKLSLILRSESVSHGPNIFKKYFEKQLLNSPWNNKSLIPQVTLFTLGESI